MTISPFPILRKIWLREATVAVQVWALLLLFLQALAKNWSDFDTRHKHDYVSDSSVVTWPNFYLPVNLFTDTYICMLRAALGLILKTLLMYAKHFFKKPPQWIKGIFMCFLQTRADTLEFRAKFYSTVQAFLKHCFSTSKLFRIWITLIPSFLFMSWTNTGTCVRTTQSPHKFPTISSCTWAQTSTTYLQLSWTLLAHSSRIWPFFLV